MSMEENSKSEAVAEKILPSIRKLPAKSSGSSKCKPELAKTRNPKVGITRIIGDPKEILERAGTLLRAES